MSLLDQHHDLIGLIESLGFIPPLAIAAGKTPLKRADKPQKTPGSLFVSDNLEVATVYDFRAGDVVGRWNATTGNHTAEDLVEMRKATAQAKAKADAELARKHKNQAASSRQEIARATIGKAPYGERKGITVPYLIDTQCNIVVPYECNGVLVGYQKLLPEKTVFKPGTEPRDKDSFGPMKNAQHVIGNESDSTLVVGEGFATNALVHQAIGYTAVVRFTASNLETFSPPSTCTHLIVPVDNDRSGTGQKAAQQLADRLATDRPDITVTLMIPPRVDSDWADYSETEIRAAFAAAVPVKIKSQYLPDDCLDSGNTIIVRAPWSSGKSRQSRRAAATARKKGKSVLIVCFSVLQARAAQQQNPGATCYLDIGPTDIVEDFAIVVVDSIQRIAKTYDLVIVDESEQITSAPLKDNLHALKNDVRGRLFVFHHLARLLRDSGRVIMMDADAGTLTDLLCQHSSRENPRYLISDYLPHAESTVEIVDSYGGFCEAIKNHDGQKHIQCAGVKEDAQTLQKQFGGRLITSTADKSDVKALVSQIANGEMITEDIVSTTTLGPSLSADVGTHNVDTVFAIIRAGSGYASLASQIQAMHRFRGVKRFVVYVVNGKMKTPLPIDPEKIRADILRGGEINRKHVTASQLQQTSVIDGVHFDPMALDILCHHQAELNRQRNDPQQWVINRFSTAGATILHRSIEDKKAKNKLDQEHRKNRKKAKADIVDAKIEIAETIDIPESLEDCDCDVSRTLYRATNTLKYTDEIARETAKRDAEKTGYYDSIRRRQKHTQPQSVLVREDRQKLESGDPVHKCTAKLAEMNLEIIGMCWHLLDGWSIDDTDPLLIPWNIRHSNDNAKISRRRLAVTPEEIRTAGQLKKILESYGVTVTSIKSNGKRGYTVDKTDALNRMALADIEATTTVQQAIAAGTNCNNYCIGGMSLPSEAAA